MIKSEELIAKQNKKHLIIITILVIVTIILFYVDAYMFHTSFSKMDIKCSDGFNENEYLEEIGKVPDQVKKSFIVNFWSISIEQEVFDEHLKNAGRDCAGITSYNAKKIWLKNTESTLHEFGHFIHRNLDDNTIGRIEALYKKEGNQIFDSRALSNRTLHATNEITGNECIVYMLDDIMLGSLEYSSNYLTGERYFDYEVGNEEIEKSYPELGHYATTTWEEYFADYFKYWINNRDNTEKMEKLQKFTPETYILFEELEQDDWGMNKTLYEKVFSSLVAFFYG